MTITTELKSPTLSSDCSIEEDIESSLIELDTETMSHSNNTCPCIGPNGSFELLTHRECLKDGAIPTLTVNGRVNSRNIQIQSEDINNSSSTETNIPVTHRTVKSVSLASSLKLSASSPDIANCQEVTANIGDSTKCVSNNEMLYLTNSNLLSRKNISRVSRSSTTGNMSASYCSCQYKVAGLTVNSTAENFKFDRVAAFMQRPRHFYSRLISCYTHLLVNYSKAFFLIVFVISSIIFGIAVCLIVTDPPSFSNPGESFQTLGTELSGRMTQFAAIRTEFSYNERVYLQTPFGPLNHYKSQSNRIPRRFKFCIEPFNPSKQPRYFVKLNSNIRDSVLSLKYLRKMCRLEKVMRQQITKYGWQVLWLVRENNRWCHPWSLPSYVAYLVNRSKCSKIVQSDVDKVLNYLSLCLPFYKNGSLTIMKCSNGMCRHLPRQCRFEDGYGAAIFEMFHFILPHFTMSGNRVGHIDRALTILPVAGADRKCRSIYESLMRESRDILGPDLVVEGADLGCTEQYIENVLRSDILWIGVGGICVFIIMCISTRSMFLAILTVIIIVYSLVIAYIIYKYVCQVDYFPFINMMAAILAIAVGADDVFIYSHIWKLTKQDTRDLPSNKLVSDTLTHTSLSIFVTSLSTGAALLINLHSCTVAIKCFGLYAAIVILVNFLLMITLTPSMIVILESCSCFTNLWQKSCLSSGFKNNFLLKLSRGVMSSIRLVCSEHIPNLITRQRALLSIIWAGLTVGSLIVVFCYPGYSFSNSLQDKQFLVAGHPFERYSMLGSQLFDFEKTFVHQTYHPIIFVWGYLPQDKRGKFNPRFDSSKDYLVPDVAAQLASPESQKWLLKFCFNLSLTMPYRNAFPAMNPCPMDLSFYVRDSLYTYARRNRCSDNKTNCCNVSESTGAGQLFPIPAREFTRCVENYQFQQGVKSFLLKEGRITGLVISMNSNVTLTAGYKQMDQFYKAVNQWLVDQLNHSSTPKEMKMGFFVSYLQLYDLESDVASFNNILLSIGAAAVIIFFTTRHLYLSIISMFTIFSVVSSLGACLVLMNWKLDIVESIIIALAVGLSIDACVHFSVAYRLSKLTSKKLRAKDSFNKAGFPVFAASLTTAFAGLPVLNSELLAYERMSIFLLLLATLSFFYTSIFLVSFLAVPFPCEEECQFHCPRFLKCFSLCGSATPARRVDKTVYSDYDLSSSYSAINHHCTSTEL